MPPRESPAETFVSTQKPAEIASAIAEFCEQHPDAVVQEDGKVIFDFRASSASPAKFSLDTEHERCTLHLWSEERNMVRRVVSFSARGGVLRLATLRFGQAQTKLVELVADRAQRTPGTKEATRKRYVALLERLLSLTFEGWKAEGFRTAMDLERSFGPAYARGSMVRGRQAWAVIGVNEEEPVTTIDGILTLGVLWLDYCREHAAGRRLYQGLRIIVPRGTATLTLSRMAWMNADAAQWELRELDQRSDEFVERDAADQGNLRTRLVHHPDEHAAEERFARAVARLMELVPAGEAERVEQRLRSPAELAFLLHGLEFARARIGLAPNSFSQTLEITVGVGASETPLNASNYVELAAKVAELCCAAQSVCTECRFRKARNFADATDRVSGVEPGSALAHERGRDGPLERKERNERPAVSRSAGALAGVCAAARPGAVDARVDKRACDGRRSGNITRGVCERA